MWTIFKIFIEFVSVLLLIYICVYIYIHIYIYWPRGIWDLGSSPRDWNCTPCIGRWSLNHWTTREVSSMELFFLSFLFFFKPAYPLARNLDSEVWEGVWLLLLLIPQEWRSPLRWNLFVYELVFLHESEEQGFWSKITWLWILALPHGCWVILGNFLHRTCKMVKKAMVTHSSILAWKIPWTEEPGGLQSMGSQRVRHNWAVNTLSVKWG